MTINMKLGNKVCYWFNWINSKKRGVSLGGETRANVYIMSDNQSRTVNPKGMEPSHLSLLLGSQVGNRPLLLVGKP